MTTPADWTTYELGDLFEFSNGINANKSAYGSGTRFINILEVITNESLTEEDIPGRVTLPKSTLARYQVKPGDVLFNRTSETQDEVGLTSVYLGDEPVVFGGFVLRGQPTTKRLESSYAKYGLRARDVRRQISARGQGAIRANVGQRDLKSVAVTLPEREEQRAIAGALDDASALVQSLVMLIAKRVDVRRGLMQELVTGRTRLAGFDADWREVRLGDHVSYLKTVALSRDQLDRESPLRYLHYGDIHTRSDFRLDAAAESMPRARAWLAGRAGRLAPGDLIFADASEDPAGVGKSVEITAVPPEGVVPGLHTIAARFDKEVLADGFKAYLQSIPEFRESLLRLAAGTKVLATTRNYISSVRLRLPGVDEQAAIAAVLTDAGAEIDALERRLESARAIKTGMMQELLTGRTRLPLGTAS